MVQSDQMFSGSRIAPMNGCLSMCSLSYTMVVQEQRHVVCQMLDQRRSYLSSAIKHSGEAWWRPQVQDQRPFHIKS